MPRRLAALVIAGAALLPNACGSSVDISGSAHETQRIVPLNGDLAEIAWALGLGDQVVGVDESASYPKEAAAHPRKFGYQRQLNAEGILSLKPTVVVGTDEAGPRSAIDQIRGAGVRVEILEVAKSPDGVPGKIRTVAGILGVPAKGDALAAQTKKEIGSAKALAARARSRPRVAFVYARGKDMLMLGGIGSRADGMIRAAGAVDAGTEAGVREFAPLTPEGLTAAQPEVFLLLDSGLESLGGLQGFLAIPGVAQTPAGKQKRVLAYDGQWLLGLGPRTGSALTRLVRDLHPELAGR